MENPGASYVFDIEGLSDAQARKLANVKVGDMIWFQRDPERSEQDEYSGRESEPESNEPYEWDARYEQDRQFESASASASEDAAGHDTGRRGEGDANASSAAHAKEVAAEQSEPSKCERQSGNVDETKLLSTESGGETPIHTVKSSALYSVTALLQAADAKVTDVHLVERSYNTQHDNAHAFYIFGKAIATVPTPTCPHAETSACKSFRSLRELAANQTLIPYTPYLNPDGDTLRQHFSHSTACPAACTDGWLPTLESLATILPPSLHTSPPLLPHRPICPVCIGLPHLREQQSLRSTLQHTLLPDIILVPAHDFTANLNTRRAEVGWGFWELNEQEWGIVFEDPLPPVLQIPGFEEEEEEEEEFGWALTPAPANEVGRRFWADALDPSAGIVLQPANEAVIAGLERRFYGDIGARGDEGSKADRCHVCLEAYEPWTRVVVLPCGHFACEGVCTEGWLRCFDRCSLCRASLVVGGDGGTGDDSEGAMGEGDVGSGVVEAGEEEREGKLEGWVDDGTMLAALRWAEQGGS